MRFLVTGVTGMLGSCLARFLVADGHEVLGAGRAPERCAEKVPDLLRALPWNGGALAAEDLRGVDAVVHLAGAPVAGRWTKAKREAILASRVEGTKALVASLAALPADGRPEVLISASAIGWYGDRGDEELTEQSEPGEGFLTEVCLGWEEEARRAEEAGIRTVCLRFGLILSLEGGALAEMLLPARLGLTGPLGSGKQWWSWIHIRDTVRLVAKLAIEPGIRGVVNGAGPSPRPPAGLCAHPGEGPAPPFVHARSCLRSEGDPRGLLG